MTLDMEFASMVFGDAEMKKRLTEDTYEALQDTVSRGQTLGRHIAGPLATAMKDWAMEHGATHFTHWFQPLTGITAEKHDAFVSPTGDGGAIMDFSGKELVMSEPDASSFPSGGLRATFEARGYTAWDPTSRAFIKDDTLYIPSVFCSYDGDALDKKMPLLRSVELVERETLRLLRAFGRTDINKVTPTVGAEQEYFLIDSQLFSKRRDLVFCRRTLFGAKSAKSQELDDHYFGSLDARVHSFMRELDRELWKRGVYAKTEHKEAAPCQYELAPIFTDVNTATDQNQLTMEFMRSIAEKHGFVCILHEKPFSGVNGSGKHNNWSLSADTGENLLNPGKDPAANTQFLLLLSAIISAVDDHQDLLRLSAIGASNDSRLGKSEAPPAIVSVSLGDDLSEILSSAASGRDYSCTADRMLNPRIKAMPRIKLDTTDRNRTSPFAFTGNKFEFRMPGSSHSIADANTVINTIVADAFSAFSRELEKAEDKEATARALIAEAAKKHERILFSGNCYADSWVEEARERGLTNLPTTVDALPCYVSEKNIELFTRYGIYSERELRSRYEVGLSNYAKVNEIAARTMLEMARLEILPACAHAQTDLANSIHAKAQLSLPAKAEHDMLSRGAKLLDELDLRANALEDALAEAENAPSSAISCALIRDRVLKAMDALRETGDALEKVTPAADWPFPTYEELLFAAR